MTAPILIAAGILALVVLAAAAVVLWRRGRPAAPDQHQGAVAGWSPLAEVGAQEAAPELLSGAEQVVIDHQALDGITAAVEAFDNSIDQAIRKILRGDTAAYMQVWRSLAVIAIVVGPLAIYAISAALHSWWRRNSGRVDAVIRDAHIDPGRAIGVAKVPGNDPLDPPNRDRGMEAPCLLTPGEVQAFADIAHQLGGGQEWDRLADLYAIPGEWTPTTFTREDYTS